VGGLFCSVGARPLGACSPPLVSRRDSSGHDPAVCPGAGPLGVRKGPRHRHPSPGPHAGDPVASGRMAARTHRANSSPHPKRAVAGRGAFNRPVTRGPDDSGARGNWTREPRWGDGGAVPCERRGAMTRIAVPPKAGSRAEECAAAAAGETQGRTQPPTAPTRQSRYAVTSGMQGGGAGTDPAHSFDQVGTRPGVQGAPALSIASWSFTRSTSRRVRSLPRTPANSSPAIS
jgi:hypothetical protein